MNASGQYALCQKKVNLPQQGNGYVLKFIILESKTGMEIYQDSVVNGDVSWVDDYVIQVKAQKGVLDRNYSSDAVYYYDIIKKQKILNEKNE